MRVLSVIVGATTRAGGVAAFTGGAARAMRRLGHEMPVLTTDLALAPHGWWQRDQARATDADLHPDLRGADVRVVPARAPRRLAFSPALARALRAEVPRADVVHIHNLWQYPQFAAYRAARRAGVPYVVSTHGALDHYLRDTGRGRKAVMQALWQRRMLEEASAIHVTTEAELDAVSDTAPEVPRFVVPCGIDAAEFTNLPPRHAFRARVLGSYDGPLVTFLGRVTAKKGLDLLIRAFARARAKLACRLAIVGPDDERLTPALQALVAELGLTRDVTFAGPQYGEHRLEALAAADVWALSSHTENFGIAVIEAMAAGCPVLISPGVSVAREIAAADAGRVAALDPEAFGDEMAGLLSDAGERERLSTAGRRLAASYDWDAVGPRLVGGYTSVLRNRRVARG